MIGKPYEYGERCKTLPTQLREWSATSLAAYMKCPRFYWLKVVEGWREPEGSVHLDFGTLIHGAADVYGKSLVAQGDPEEATLDAVGWALEAAYGWGGRYQHVWFCNKGTVRSEKSKSARLRCPEAKGKWPVLGEVPQHCPTCGGPTVEEIAFFPLDRIKNHQSLIRSVVEYCDTMTKSAIRPYVLPDGRVGSELPFNHKLSMLSPDGTPYEMSGTWDQLATLGEEELILPDIKTTQKNPNEGYFAAFDPSVQFLTYDWAGAKDFPEQRPVPYIICLHVQQNNTDVYVYPLRHTPALLAEHERDMGYWIKRAEYDARLAEVLGEEAYRRNTTACNSTPGAPTTPCMFRGICRMDPSERSAFLRSNFRRN